MTDAPVTEPSDLRRRVKEERERLLTVIGEVGAERSNEPGVEGTWSCVDILGHVTFWDEQALRNLELVAEGRVDEVVRPESTEEVDAMNAREVEGRQGQTLGQVLARYGQLALQLDARLLAVSREDLEREVKGLRIGALVAVDTYDHYREHREAIEAWLART